MIKLSKKQNKINNYKIVKMCYSKNTLVLKNIFFEFVLLKNFFHSISLKFFILKKREKRKKKKEEKKKKRKKFIKK